MMTMMICITCVSRHKPRWDPCNTDTELSVLYSNTYFDPKFSVAAAQSHRVATLATKAKKRTKDKMSDKEYQAKRANLQQHNEERTQNAQCCVCNELKPRKTKGVENYTSYQWRNRHNPGFPSARTAADSLISLVFFDLS